MPSRLSHNPHRRLPVRRPALSVSWESPCSNTEAPACSRPSPQESSTFAMFAGPVERSPGLECGHAPLGTHDRDRPRAGATAVPATGRRGRRRHPARAAETRRRAAGFARTGRIPERQSQYRGCGLRRTGRRRAGDFADRRRHLRRGAATRVVAGPAHAGVGNAHLCVAVQHDSGAVASRPRARYLAVAQQPRRAVAAGARTGPRLPARDRPAGSQRAHLHRSTRTPAPAHPTCGDAATHTRIAPGDAVVIEALSYPPARRVMELAGARLLPVPVDHDGLDVDALETLLKREPLRAVLLTPHHQFPTTVVMSPARRARLAALAMQHRFAIIEDDYDHEFHYDGKPVLPIAAGVARANVVYVGSLANILAPGLCTAFISAPLAVMQRLVALRATSDAQGDAAVECAIAELFEDGELLRHVRRMRRLYQTRRDALTTALERRL